MPPEAMMGRKITEKADVYSYGIVLWEIVTQEVPFPDAKSFPKFRQAVCLNHVRPPLDNIKIPSIRNLLNLCWHKEPAVRPAFEEIVKIIDVILIDCAIKDEEGRAFWKKSFLGKEYVPFDEFLPKFLSEHNLPMPDTIHMECFKLLASTQLADNIMIPIDIVKINNFGNFLENFGPITTTTERRGKKETLNIFKRVGDFSQNFCNNYLIIHLFYLFLILDVWNL